MSKRPPPDNGPINDNMLGHGEPIRVREGQRVLWMLSASATENVTLALDGNRAPKQPAIDT